MKICTRVGIDVTWRCNWSCKHCFYRRNPYFHSKTDIQLSDIYSKIIEAKSNGMDHVVFTGFGEPSLYPHAIKVLDFCRDIGMATSMITNGAVGLCRFKELYQHGLDHLHISSHGLIETLDEIVGVKGAWSKQNELKLWLQQNNLPFRTNVTLQQKNYFQLPALAEYECNLGVYHFVFLGFLPHYEWNKHVTEVAVHPCELQSFVEVASDILIKRQTLFTIRYHPFCYLKPQYWKYVVNAKYVPYDPFEWNYELTIDPKRVEIMSHSLGEQVANKCEGCLMRRHCGGWNKTYAEALNVELKPVHVIPDEYKDVWQQDGGLHDLNPTNHETGTLCKKK